MKTKETLLAIIFIFAVLVSCDSSNTCNLPNVSNDYFPLHIGDKWEYANHIRKVSAEVTINSKQYMLVVSEIYQADTLYDSRELFYRNVNGKVYQLYTDQSDEFLFVDFTLDEGESWTYDIQLNDDDQWNVTAQEEICFDFGNTVLEHCKPFYYDVSGWADEEQVYVFAPGIGEINNYSPAWGNSDTIQKAQIDGIEYVYK